MQAFRSDDPAELHELAHLVMAALREIGPDASVARIAGRVDYSQPSVQEALHELESLRLVTWDWDTRHGTRRRLYSIDTAVLGGGAA